MTKKLAASRDWLKLDHYLIAAYASTEKHYQRIVVVDPTIAEPTWLLKPRARSCRHGNVLALLLPNLESLTVELAQTLTRMRTDYIGVREWPEAERAMGRIHTHAYPLVTGNVAVLARRGDTAR